MSVQTEVASIIRNAGYDAFMFDYDFNVGAAVEKDGRRHAVRGPDPVSEREASRRFWSRPASVIASEMIDALEQGEPAVSSPDREWE